jgi:CRP/FNR family cyclic AMP-dependent transcriptional regulator
LTYRYEGIRMIEQIPINFEQSNLAHDIEKYGKVELFSKGMPIYTSEEMLKKFFFVLKGRIKVFHINPEDGKEQTLKILTRGDMYDVVSLLDSKIHYNLVEALDDVQLMVFPIEVVREWLTNDSEFNKLLFPYIAKQYREMEELALDLSFYDTATRLLKLLSKNLNHQDNLIHDLSHEEIASLIGTVRKVLNRHIQKLKDDGVIDVSYKNIEIKDTQKLLDNLPL